MMSSHNLSLYSIKFITIWPIKKHILLLEVWLVRFVYYLNCWDFHLTSFLFHQRFFLKNSLSTYQLGKLARKKCPNPTKGENWIVANLLHWPLKIILPRIKVLTFDICKDETVTMKKTSTVTRQSRSVVKRLLFFNFVRNIMAKKLMPRPTTATQRASEPNRKFAYIIVDINTKGGVSPSWSHYNCCFRFKLVRFAQNRRNLFIVTHWGRALYIWGYY